MSNHISASGVARISIERQRQIFEEGWSAQHDWAHDGGELAVAAACYALAHGDTESTGVPSTWPFEASWWKPSDDPIRNLEKAGALIAAEIDRLNSERIKAAQGKWANRQQP